MGTSNRIDEQQLLEREAELETISGLLATAREGVGAVCLIEGPAGIGKSTLLAHARAAAAATGMAVLQARGSLLEQGYPFAAATQLFDAPVRSLTATERAELAGGLPRPVAEALLAPGGTGDHLTANETSGFAAMSGLHQLLVVLAARGPLLIAIDDAQLADEPTLRFLHFAAGRISRLGVALIATIRTGEPASEALEALRAEAGATVLRPAPLSAAASATFVRATFPGAGEAFCDACARVTAGNPFYLRELVGTALSEGLETTDAATAQLEKVGPGGIARPVLSRLGRMPSACRELAAALAVSGDRSSLATIAALAELEIREAAGAADLLASADIVDGGDTLSFVHPLVREVIYADLPPTRRALMHRDAAGLLSETGAPAQRVAAHLLEAAAGADSWARAALREAALQAQARGAPEVSVRYLRRALDEGPTGAERAELLLGLGLAMTMSGEPAGTDLLREAAAGFEDPYDRALTLMNVGRILGVRGQFGDSAKAFDGATEALAPTGTPVAWWAEAGSAMSGSHHLPTRSRDRRRLEQLLLRSDLGESSIGRSVLAFGAIERVYEARPAPEALELARALSSREIEDAEIDGVAFRIAAMVFALCGEIEEAAALAERVEEAARRMGSRVEAAAVWLVWVLIETQRGRIEELIAAARGAADGLRLGWGIGIPVAHAALAWALLERGEPDAAGQALMLDDDERPWRQDLFYPAILEIEGMIQLAGGDAPAALRAAEACGEMMSERELVNPAVSAWGWRSVAALAAAQLGEREQARRWAREELELARRFGSPRSAGISIRTLALVEPTPSTELLAQSVETLRGSPSRLELSRSLLELGAALRRRNSRRESRTPLREALDLARRAGATALAERAEAELKAAGARPRNAYVSGIDALTPSERRVAELAARGLSNPQIADQLFLTRKTIETHLSRAYAKLEIGGRDQLAEALAPDQA